MELANLQLAVREAKQEDVPALTRLLQLTPYSHLHVDWSLPVDWIGTPGFVLAETTNEHPSGRGKVRACLAVGADPPPAAWVRAAAVRRLHSATPLLGAMLESVLPYLRLSGVTELGWLPRGNWPGEAAKAIGFRKLTAVMTYVKRDVTVPASIQTNGDVVVRPVERVDYPALAAIERAAFAPLWRHSATGLVQSKRFAVSFDVAELAGRIVAFQYSTADERSQSAHLVRLTVSPDAQRSGVGATLLAAAIQGYDRRGLKQVSLNTQEDNTSSRKLYERFGFEPFGARWPVWWMAV